MPFARYHPAANTSALRTSASAAKLFPDTMRACDVQPFRFLDLPRDIRFRVYDFMLQTTLRHHTIGFSHRYSLKIVNSYVTFLPLLFTCREIYTEATPLHNQLATIASAPIRLIVLWHSMGGAAMRAILRCASSPAEECVGSSDLDVLQPRPNSKEGRWQDRVEWLIRTNYSQEESWGASQLLRNTRPPMHDLIRCPFTSHDDLHALLHRTASSIKLVRVEVAIECTASMQLNEIDPLNTYVERFFEWVSAVQSQTDTGSMSVQLRTMPFNDEDGEYLENHVLRYMQSLQRGKKEGKWHVGVGDFVWEEEREERWDESMRSP